MERLLPSTILVLILTGIWIAYANAYQPPAAPGLSLSRYPPAAATVGAFVLANTLGTACGRSPSCGPS